jgi:hypothetical protein
MWPTTESLALPRFNSTTRSLVLSSLIARMYRSGVGGVLLADRLPVLGVVSCCTCSYAHPGELHG